MDEAKEQEIQKVADVSVRTHNPEYAVRRLVDRRQKLLKRGRVPRAALESVINEANEKGMTETVKALQKILGEVVVIEAEVDRLGFELIVDQTTQSCTWRKKLDQFDE